LENNKQTRESTALSVAYNVERWRQGWEGIVGRRRRVATWTYPYTQWSEDDSFKLLSLDAVDKFCPISDKQARARTQNAKYKNTDDDPDKQFSLQVLDRKQHNVDQVEELPCDKDTQNPVTRWAKECCDLSNTDTIDLYQNWNWRDFQNYQRPLESCWRLALRINEWGINRRPAKQQINEDDTKQNDAGGETEHKPGKTRMGLHATKHMH